MLYQIAVLCVVFTLTQCEDDFFRDRFGDTLKTFKSRYNNLHPSYRYHEGDQLNKFIDDNNLQGHYRSPYVPRQTNYVKSRYDPNEETYSPKTAIQHIDRRIRPVEPRRTYPKGYVVTRRNYPTGYEETYHMRSPSKERNTKEYYPRNEYNSKPRENIRHKRVYYRPAPVVRKTVSRIRYEPKSKEVQYERYPYPEPKGKQEEEVQVEEPYQEPVEEKRAVVPARKRVVKQGPQDVMADCMKNIVAANMNDKEKKEACNMYMGWGDSLLKGDQSDVDNSMKDLFNKMGDKNTYSDGNYYKHRPDW